jgi:YD repeat-containing protein
MDQMTLPDPDGTGGFDRPVYDYVFDKNSNLFQVVDPDPDDKPGAPGPRLRSVTHAVFDERNRMTQLTLGFLSANPAVRKFEYDAANQLTAEIVDMNGAAADARKTRHDYDRLGRVVKTTLPDPDGEGTGDPAPFWAYEFDTAGNLARVADPRNQGTTNATVYAYDRLHQVLSVMQPDPDLGGELLSPVTTYEYNDAGDVTRTRDPLNHGTENWTEFTYDGMGLKTSERLPEPGDGGQRPWTLFLYDRHGRPTKTQQVIGVPDSSGGESNDLSTQHVYDRLGRRTSTHHPAGGLTRFEYDLAGNRTKLIDPVNNDTIWTYDGLDRVTAETNELGHSRLYEHDQLNNLTKLTDRRSQVRTFEYDTLYRRTAENWLNAQGAEFRSYEFTYK